MPKSVPPTRFWPRATAMGPATMPRPRRGAGRRPLAHSRLLYAHCLDSSPRPAARPCLPRGRACRGVHALNYFFPHLCDAARPRTRSLLMARASPTDAPMHGFYGRRLEQRAAVLWRPPRALCGRGAQYRRRLRFAGARTRLASRCLSMASADAAVTGPRRTGRAAQNFHDAGKVFKVQKSK